VCYTRRFPLVIHLNFTVSLPPFISSTSLSLAVPSHVSISLSLSSASRPALTCSMMAYVYQFKTLTKSMELKYFSSCRHLLSHGRFSQNFMEPEGSLPCSQEPSTGPYPEPDQFSPYGSILLLQDPFQYHCPIYI
jgi:hypothetical protein